MVASNQAPQAMHLHLFAASTHDEFDKFGHPHHAHAVVVAFTDDEHARTAVVVCADSEDGAGVPLERLHARHKRHMGDSKGHRAADRATAHALRHLERTHGSGVAEGRSDRAAVWHLGDSAAHHGEQVTAFRPRKPAQPDDGLNHTELLLGLLDDEDMGEDWYAQSMGPEADHRADEQVASLVQRAAAGRGRAGAARGADGEGRSDHDAHREGTMRALLSDVRSRGARASRAHGAGCVELEVRWGGNETARFRVDQMGSAAVHTVLPRAITPGHVVRGANAALLQVAEAEASAAASDVSVGVAAGASAAARAAVYLQARVPGLDQILTPVIGMVMDPLVGQVVDMVGGRIREGGAANTNHAVDGKAPPIIAAALRVGVGADVLAAVPDAVAAGVTRRLPQLLARMATVRAAELVPATSDAVVRQLLSPATMARRRAFAGPAALAGQRRPLSDPRASGSPDADDELAGLPADVERRIDDALGLSAGQAVGAGPETGPRRSGSRLPSDLSAGEWAGNNGLDGMGNTAAPARSRDFVAAALGVEAVPFRVIGEKEPVRPSDGKPLRPAAAMLQTGAVDADAERSSDPGLDQPAAAGDAPAAAVDSDAQRFRSGYAGDERTRTTSDPRPPSSLRQLRVRGTLEDVVVEAVSREMSMRLERALAARLVPRVTMATSLGVVAGVTRAAGGPWPSSAEMAKLDCAVCKGHGNEAACLRCSSPTATGTEADQFASYYAGYYGAYYAEYYSKFYGEAMRSLDRVNAFRQQMAVPPWGPRWFAARCASRKVAGPYGSDDGAADIVCADDAGAPREEGVISEEQWEAALPASVPEKADRPPIDASLWLGEAPDTMPPLGGGGGGDGE
ncbi:hypothetical protein FNF27_01691 [Cafeteria roenbergensis]|uniref:Uncharacterized protein n=1 Tax=Cafeteria roenbergensis TaxID=33653 RepID=A0A5A8EH06_CAFRO|nr:hypothetical protein FNF27_01691 [Cafeteria roenbergensis]